MNLDEKPTHYEILNLPPDASVSQIREAYLRVKSTYNKDSLALYTLIEPSEREEILMQVEEAYAVLSDTDKRKEYDSCHGLLRGRIEDRRESAAPARSMNVVSIDRVPPMSSHSGDELLVPPSTDFSGSSGFGTESTDDPFDIPSPPSAPVGPRSYALPSAPPSRPSATSSAGSSEPPPISGDLIAALASETDWTGTFLKRVREARKISIEELSHATKISKTYLFAIEEENFSKLPAPVFVRGFINQLARVLKLPPEGVVNAYMGRFNQARSESKK